MNRRQKIIVSITGIFIVLLALIGLTYAYFLTRITGNENDKSISVTTANLELVYEEDDDEYVIGEDEIIEPGKTFETKTFTVTNNGNSTIDSYAVILEDVSITYVNDTDEVSAGQITTLGSTIEGKENDFTLIITCKNQDQEVCNGYNAELLETSGILLTNSIEVGETQTYTATLTYNETNNDQSADMNKRYNGKFNIIDTKDTIDLSGTVTNYEAGDYVQTNSTKRVSVIYPDKTYKIMGLEAGTHKLKVCAKSVTNCTDETAKMTETINIVKGDSSSVDTTTKTITITNFSRTIGLNIDATNKNLTFGDITESPKIRTTYSNGNVIAQKLTKAIDDPDIKTQAWTYPFTVSNISDEHQNLTIKLTDIVMDDVLKDIDFRWGLYNADTGNAINYGIFKDVENNELLLYRDTIIDAGAVPKNYIFRMWIHDDGTDQVGLLNKDISAKIVVNAETIEYTPESCFTFNNGTITAYDTATCGTDVVIPKTINGVAVKTLGNGNFDPAIGAPEYGVWPSSLIIPEGIATINSNFVGWYDMNHITVPETVTTIGDSAFTYPQKQLPSLILPETITSLQSNSFDANITTFVAANDAMLRFMDHGSASNLILMDGVTTIYDISGSYTFLEIPKTVTTVSEYAWFGSTIPLNIVIRGKNSLEEFTGGYGGLLERESDSYTGFPPNSTIEFID